MAIFQREAVVLAATGSLAILALLLRGCAPSGVLRAWRRRSSPPLPSLPPCSRWMAANSRFSWSPASCSPSLSAQIIACSLNAPPPAQQHGKVGGLDRAGESCTVAAYGLMSLSGIPVLHDIGLTVSIGTFLSLVCGAVLSTPSGQQAA